jgi:predicted RNA binding protein YcfA (HicA-like mRNA interferase family)
LPKFRRLSGREIIRIFESYGFVVVSQRGSHVKLRRTLPDATRQTLVVPEHKELDTGTCRAIFRQACEFVPENELLLHFRAE